MRLSELVRSPSRASGTARIRSALTMLGIIIGVASVVALVAVGQGASSGITNRISSLGTQPADDQRRGDVQRRRPAGRGLRHDPDPRRRDRDQPARRRRGGRTRVSSSQTVIAGHENTTTTILGTTQDYPTVRHTTCGRASFLTDTSVEQSLRVAVLGSTTADDLGLGARDIGSTISIGGIPFQLIGILQAKGGTGFTSGDDQVLIPVATLEQLLLGRRLGRPLDRRQRRTRPTRPRRRRTITALLEQRHDIDRRRERRLLRRRPDPAARDRDVGHGLLTLLLAGIASISLIVGGIGIMNIMLVSVTRADPGDRHPQGHRRPERDILTQFLVEALVLSAPRRPDRHRPRPRRLGADRRDRRLGFTFNPLTLVVATAFSLAVGVVFGVWPARQAAGLNPISALRFDRRPRPWTIAARATRAPGGPSPAPVVAQKKSGGVTNALLMARRSSPSGHRLRGRPATAPAAATTGFPAAFRPASFDPGAAPGGALGGGNAALTISGTVKSIDGTTMTITTANGTDTVVDTSSSTFHSQAAASASDVQTGSSVKVSVTGLGGFRPGGPAASGAPDPSAAAGSTPIKATDVTVTPAQ